MRYLKILLFLNNRNNIKHYHICACIHTLKLLWEIFITHFSLCSWVNLGLHRYWFCALFWRWKKRSNALCFNHTFPVMLANSLFMTWGILTNGAFLLIVLISCLQPWWSVSGSEIIIFDTFNCLFIYWFLFGTSDGEHR